MTTAAMVFGVVPLIAASGAGAVSRFNTCLVTATGVSIGALFTLFVVPAMYMMLGAEHTHEARAPRLREAEAALASGASAAPGTIAPEKT